MDSQTTPGRQVKFSAPSSQGPSGKLQEDEPADDSGEKKSSKPPSVVREGKPAAAVPVSAPDTQHGAAPDHVAVEQKFSPSGNEVISSTDWTNSAHSSSYTLQTNCPATSKVYLPFQVKILSILCRRLSLLNQQKKTLLLLQLIKPAHLKEQLIKIT